MLSELQAAIDENSKLNRKLIELKKKKEDLVEQKDSLLHDSSSFVDYMSQIQYEEKHLQSIKSEFNSTEKHQEELQKQLDHEIQVETQLSMEIREKENRAIEKYTELIAAEQDQAVKDRYKELIAIITRLVKLKDESELLSRKMQYIENTSRK